MAAKEYRAKKIISKLLLGILVLVIIISILFPLYFVLISSFKNVIQVYIMPPKLFGFRPVLDNYVYIFKIQHCRTYMMNSTIMAVAPTALSLLLGIPAAYAITRYKMGEVNTAILTARLLPNISILLPYHSISSKLRMIDTYDVLILSHMVLPLPLIVWIMVGFFSDLPLELEEAAVVDDCTRQKCFKDVLLSVSAPGLVTCSTLSFLGSWNNFQSALIPNDEKTGTPPVSPQYFVSGADIRWERMLAAAIVVIVPTTILTMLLQKCIVQGMTTSAVKGWGRVSGRNRSEAATKEVSMVIPVLVHGRGVYDSSAMRVKYTRMVPEGSRIRGMGRFEELGQVYPDIRVMDFSDSYILLGLVNTHIHLEFTPCRDTYGIYRRENREARLARAAEHAGALLRSGVTTVRDAGSSMDLVGALPGREARSEPGTELPRIRAAGIPLTPDGGHLAFLRRASNSTEELIQAVKERKLAGCGCVKLIVNGGQLAPGSVPEYDTYSREEIRAAVEAAYGLGLPTTAHCLTTSSCVNAMRAGVDSVGHCACFRRNCRLGLLERCCESDVMEAFRGDHRYFMIGVFSNYHQLNQVREGVRRPDKRGASLLEQEKREREIFSRLADLGMRPLVGTDAGYEYTFFDETWLEMKLLYRRCGPTPKKAIHAAILGDARTLGYGDFLGRLAPGYETDFITVTQNPIRDIEAFRRIKHIACRGKIIE